MSCNRTTCVETVCWSGDRMGGPNADSMRNELDVNVCGVV